jgi:hypothetical protein
VLSALPVKTTFEQPVVISDCGGDNNISARMLSLHENLDENYFNAVDPVIEQQVAKAGARLALILNQLWQ